MLPFPSQRVKTLWQIRPSRSLISFPLCVILLHEEILRESVTVFFLCSYFSAFCHFRYGGVSVGGVNSQVRLTEADIEVVFRDLRVLLGSSQVRHKYSHSESSMMLKPRECLNIYHEKKSRITHYILVQGQDIQLGNSPEEKRRMPEVSVFVFQQHKHIKQGQDACFLIHWFVTDRVAPIVGIHL